MFRSISESTRFLLLCLMLLTLHSADAGAATRARESAAPVRRNNLILEGALPGATALRVWIDGPGIEKPIESIIPLRSGALLEGIAVPAGDERKLRAEAISMDEQVVFTGEFGFAVGKEWTQPLHLDMKSSLDGTIARLTIASHRVAIEAFGTGVKETLTTRLQARFYDADGAIQPVSAEDVQWDIDDPWIREHFTPCKGSNGPPPPCVEFLPRKPGLKFIATACIKKNFCAIEFVPGGPWVWRAISVAQGHHACALKYDGSAYCWGQGEHGQLGAAVPRDCTEFFPGENPSSKPWGCATTPVQVQCAGGPCNFIAISTGFEHTCAIDVSQDAWCWGGNFIGELGNGMDDPTQFGSPIPQRVIGGKKFKAITAGTHFTCGVTTFGDVYCWGHNRNSVVPQSLNTMEPAPVQVPFLGPATAIEAGFGHVCAQASNGRLYCWGTGALGQFGTQPFPAAPLCGAFCPALPVLMQFAGVPGFDSQKHVSLASAGFDHTCANMTSGEIVCWPIQLPVPGLPLSFERLSSGKDNYCALVQGVVLCAGRGTTGMLGDGSEEFSIRGPSRPQPPPGLFREIDLGLTSTCAITSDDKLYCWGSNRFGKLGNGAAEVPALVPVRVSIP